MNWILRAARLHGFWLRPPRIVRRQVFGNRFDRAVVQQHPFKALQQGGRLPLGQLAQKGHRRLGHEPLQARAQALVQGLFGVGDAGGLGDRPGDPFQGQYALGRQRQKGLHEGQSR